MSGLAHYRKRNRTVCFWMTYDERRELEARIIVCGMPRGQYFIQSLLHQQIAIAVGKYQSDRLSLEIKRLNETLGGLQTNDVETLALLTDCKALMEQFIDITSVKEKTNDKGR